MNVFKDEGLTKIRAATGDAMWKAIDQIVVGWAKKNPAGANMNRFYNEERRAELKLANNKTGKWEKSYSGKNLRVSAETKISLAIHPELMNAIEVFFPDFFASKDNVRKFGTIYKMFKIPEKFE